MATIDDARNAVDVHWPTDLPSWPDPHAGGAPVKEEYSRLTDAGRYRIVVDRARAWTQACRDVLHARIEEQPPGGALPGDRGGWTITSPRPGTRPLEVRVSHIELDQVQLGCGEASAIEAVPDCGCDACDCGSALLLRSIDEWFTTALTGGLVHVWGDGWSTTRRGDGQTTSGSPERAGVSRAEVTSLLEAVACGGDVDLPAGVRAVSSGRWVD